jgi:hypothetical protein
MSPTSVVDSPILASSREIPYDYVAKFRLKGIDGNRVTDVINVSVEGAFVAVAIGYSFIPASPSTPRVARATTDLRAGVKYVGAYNTADFVDDPRAIARCLFQRFCGVDFLYSIVDSASGRELQNLPIHNVAGLGEPGGNRPFRPLAKPMLFAPRSTIRIEIEELSRGPMYKGSQVYMVLHGYKILGYGGPA